MDLRRDLPASLVVFLVAVPLSLGIALASGAPVIAGLIGAVAGGIVTGVMLALARVAGEAAPLLFTALSNQFWTINLLEPMANLPVTIFKFAMSPFVDWQRLAWAGVFLITMGVLALNIIARVLFKEEIKR